MSAFSRDMFFEVGLVSGRVRRGRFSVGTCSAKSAYCRDMSEEVGYCRDVNGEVLLVWGRVRRGRLSGGTCSTRSV